MKKNKAIYNLTIIIMLVGFLLSLLNFLLNRSLWVDEAMLALNIIDRSFAGLLTPLDNFQVSPIGFLYIEKILSMLIPNSELGLRLFLLLCFWASICLFYKVVKLLIKDEKIVLLAVSLFCLNIFLIYYAAEVKQYMTDVFVALLLYFLLLKEYTIDKRKYIWLAVVGAISIFISLISIIILCTIAAFLIIEQIRLKKINYIGLAIPFIAWTLTFSIYYFLFIHGHPSKNNQIDSHSGFFMPLNIFSSPFVDFCLYQSKIVFSNLLPFGRAWIIIIIFFIIGIYGLIKTNHKKILLLLLLPFLLHLSLSALKIYPFALRLILYQTALYIIILSFGIIYSINQVIKKTNIGWLIWFSAIFPVITCINLYRNYPCKKEEIKNTIEFISNNIKPNETVYIYDGAVNAFNYYLKIGKVPFKNKLVFGSWNRSEPKKYVEEIERNKTTCWILFSHIHENENTYIINSLDSTYNRTRLFKTEGSETYLYNLVNKK